MLRPGVVDEDRDLLAAPPHHAEPSIVVIRTRTPFSGCPANTSLTVEMISRARSKPLRAARSAVAEPSLAITIRPYGACGSPSPMATISRSHGEWRESHRDR